MFDGELRTKNRPELLGISSQNNLASTGSKYSYIELLGWEKSYLKCIIWIFQRKKKIIYSLGGYILITYLLGLAKQLLFQGLTESSNDFNSRNTKTTIKLVIW